MRSFIRIGLPILLVAGLVFGITFIKMYSGGGDDSTNPVDVIPGKASLRKEPPLRFFMDTAVAGSEPKHMRYWDSEFEVGASGHFEYWCQNRNLQPVSIRVPFTNCQCAGVQMAVVGPADLEEYRVLSALAGGPFSSAGPMAALVHARFDQTLRWESLYEKGGKTDRVVPAADPATGPRTVLVKLTWTGKESVGRKTISGMVYASLGEAAPASTELHAQIEVVSGFEAFRREGPTDWKPVDSLLVGDLRENSAASQSFFLISYTRTNPTYSVALEFPDPCVSVSAPRPASEEEVASVMAFAGAGEAPARRPKSVHRVDVTVREHTDAEEGGMKVMRHLDLGALDRRLTVTASEADAKHLTIRGRVLGELTLLGGSDAGRIELGNSFPASQDRSEVVTLVADRPGTDIKLLEAETQPTYLKAKLEPQPPLPDGRKQWRLRVTIPKNELFGTLPASSAIYLQTNGTPPRRLRLPVRGQTFDTGGPRL